MVNRHSHVVRVVRLLLVLLAVSACTSRVASQPTQRPLPTHVPTLPPSSTPKPTQTLPPTPIPLPTATQAIPVTKEYQKPGDYIDSITVEGTVRWFTVHLPPVYQPGVPMPLVLNLHPYSSTAFGQEALSGMNAKADEEGFIVVNPQALNDPPSWWGPLPGEPGKPDRDFFRELLAFLQRELGVDPARIYATGMSNGGTMTYRLGCDMSDTFAAIAPVSGGHVAHPFCEPERPVSVLVIHGTEDRLIPYDGNGADSPPVHVWLEAWAEHNGCDSTPKSSHPHQHVTRETWSNCDENVEVALLTLEGGGHTWPGGPSGMTSSGVFPYMDATDAIWDFFESHPKMLDP